MADSGGFPTEREIKSSLRQLLLPGVRIEPTRSEILPIVRERLNGFELRHAARLAKRKAAAARLKKQVAFLRGEVAAP